MDAGNAQEKLTSVVAEARLGAAPLTVDLAPDSGLASAFRADSHVPTVLAIERIEGIAAQPVRINVFLNRPDADNHSSTEDPSCLGFIQLLPMRGTVRPVGHAFDLSQVRDLDPAKPIRVTLVPVVGTDSKPSDLSLQIGRIYLRRER